MPLPNEDLFSPNHSVLSSAYSKSERKEKRLFYAIIAVLKGPITTITILSLVLSIINIIEVLTMRRLINNLLNGYMETVENQMYGIGGCMSVILLTGYFGGLLSNYITFKALREANKVMISLYGMIVEKAIRVNLTNSDSSPSGQIYNLVQLDTPKFETFLLFYYQLLYPLLLLLLNGILMFYILGPQTIFVASSVIAFNALVVYIYKCMIGLRSNQLLAKDKRIGYFKNIVNHLTQIKMNAYETIYYGKLYFLRENELSYSIMMILFTGLTVLINWMGSKIIVITIVLLQAFTDSQILPYDAISTLLKINNDVEEYLIAMPFGYSCLQDWYISVKRIDEFLGIEEIKREWISYPNSTSFSIKMKEGDFSWTGPLNKTSEPIELQPIVDDHKSGTKEFQLGNINLEIKKGNLVFILGKTGHGKSSLLYSLFGEMPPISSNTTLEINKNRIGLTQSPWLLGASIRDNILLGEEVDEKRLNQAIQLSQLHEDLKSMSQGLDTNIGENGGAISGGQRMRVVLARCFYRRPSLMILDDPFASLDITVSRKIMSDAILNEFKQSTRVIATNSTAHIQHADQILILDSGRIRFNGSYAELSNSPVLKELSMNEKVCYFNDVRLMIILLKTK